LQFSRVLIIFSDMRHTIVTVLLMLNSVLSLHSDTLSTSIPIPLDIVKGILKTDSYVPYYLEKRPRIGLALSGGGSRGLAQIGVLKVFDRIGLSIDCIAGTSMGAFVGGLYASGYSAAQIESLACQIRWDDIIKDAPPRKQLFLGQKEEKSRSILQVRFKNLSLDFRPAYTSGQKLMLVLNDILFKAPYPLPIDFNALPISFRIVCTNFLSGQKVILNHGPLTDAIRASMAVPLLFTPLAYGDSLLMDGGLVDNLPVIETKNMGSDLVIAVDTSSKIRDKNSLKAPWEIADQVTTIMQQQQVNKQFNLADVPIAPELGDFTNTDFSRIPQLIQAGERAAEKAIESIETMISDSTPKKENPRFIVRSISCSGAAIDDPINPAGDSDTLHTLSLGEIQWLGQSIYQTGTVSSVTARLDTCSHNLTFEAQPFPKIISISLSGNTVFPDTFLLARMETRTGEVLNFQKGRRDLKKIVSLYHRLGYALARIQKIDFKEGNLAIEIDEGRLEDIVLRGNQRTRTFVVFREMPMKKGDLFQVSLLKQGLENIYSTGYFESVRFQINSIQKHHVLNLILLEQGYTLLRAGTRFDTERQAQGFLEIAEENALGLGAEASLTGLIGKRDRFLQSTIRADRIFKTFITTRFTLSVQNRDYPYFENNRQLGWYQIQSVDQALLFGQQLRRLGTISFQLKNERLRVFSLENNGPLDQIRESLSIRNLTLRSEVDTRDRMPYPNSGKYHILEYETGLSFLGSEVPYFKITSCMESFYPINKNVVLFPRIRWGTADPTIPFAKRYHLGGMDSFLGFHEDAMVGKRFVCGSLGLRVRVPTPGWMETHIAIRYDIGSVWDRYTNISLEDFRHGIGLMLLINTPIGPVQAGMGWADRGNRVAYFSTGYRL
jgi:NTE family protein